MKKFLLIFIVLLVFSPLNAGIMIDYKSFDISNVDAKFRFYTDSLFGARGDGLRMGGTVSTLDYNQSFTSYNPACLAFQKSPVASFSGIPLEFVSTDVAGFVINRDFDVDFANAITSTASGLISPAEATIQNASIYAAQANGATAMEGMLPLAQNNVAIGVAREEKFGLELNLLAEGIKAEIDLSDPANPFFAMSLTATAGFAAGVNIKSIVTSFGIGRKITPQWGIGAILEYIDTRISIEANADAKATAVDQTAGSPTLGTIFEYGTNPGNSLEQNLKGELKAASWGFRVGSSFHTPNDEAEISVDFSIQPEFNFEGGFTGTTHSLPNESVMLSNYLAGKTSTTAKSNDSSDTVAYMKLPSYIRAGVAWKPGPIISFNYTKYFDSFGIAFENKNIKAIAAYAVSDIFRIGFNFEYFQIGGGVMLGAMAVEMDIANDASPGTSMFSFFTLPIASMGFVIPMGKYVKSEWELIAFPLPVLKASLTVSY